MIRELPGLFKHGFIFDPWGTRIELVEDPEPGRVPPHSPERRQSRCDVDVVPHHARRQAASLKGRQNGLRFGEVWLLVSRQEAGTPTASTQGRAIDHVAFVVKEFDKAVGRFAAAQGHASSNSRACREGGRTARRPRLSAVRTASASRSSKRASRASRRAAAPEAVTTDTREPYTTPRTAVGRAGSAGHLLRQLRSWHSARASQGAGRRQGADGRKRPRRGASAARSAASGGTSGSGATRRSSTRSGPHRRRSRW